METRLTCDMFLSIAIAISLEFVKIALAIAGPKDDISLPIYWQSVVKKSVLEPIITACGMMLDPMLMVSSLNIVCISSTYLSICSSIDDSIRWSSLIKEVSTETEMHLWNSSVIFLGCSIHVLINKKPIEYFKEIPHFFNPMR